MLLNVHSRASNTPIPRRAGLMHLMTKPAATTIRSHLRILDRISTAMHQMPSASFRLARTGIIIIQHLKM